MHHYYLITAVAVESGDETIINHQIPTFILNSDVQGIVSEEHAARVAEDIINPCGNPDIRVNCCITKLDMSLMSVG